MGEHTVGSAIRQEPTGAALVDDGLALGGRPSTVYEGLRAALAKKTEEKLSRLTVPKRPEIKLVFKPDFPYEMYEAWVKKATSKKGEVDQMRVALTVIAYTNRQILLDDEVVRKGGDGEELTVAHHDVHAFLGVPAGATGMAIRKLYDNDGHMIQAMKKIVEDAGYSIDGDVQDADDDENPLVN